MKTCSHKALDLKIPRICIQKGKKSWKQPKSLSTGKWIK